MAAAKPPLLLALDGRIARSDVEALSTRVCGALDAGAALVACDVACAAPCAATVDALARLQLEARRRGSRVRILHASSELLELVTFMGLGEVLAG
jgi:diphthamide biosynthesis methyltransferase